MSTRSASSAKQCKSRAAEGLNRSEDTLVDSATSCGRSILSTCAACVTSRLESIALRRRNMQLNRFFINEKIVEEVRIVRRKSSTSMMQQKKAPQEKAWSLEDSVWPPRAKYADSKGVHDTEDHMIRVLECDWKYALAEHATEAFIKKHCKANKGTQAAVDGCYAAFAEHHNMVYSMFDYYATLGSGEPFAIQLNAFTMFVEECELVDAKNPNLKKTNFDQLFLAVNAGTDNIRALDRVGWLQVLLKIAHMKYMTDGAIENYGEALRTLLDVDVLQTADSRALHDATTLRERYCYTQEVDAVLRTHYESLRSLFKVHPRNPRGPRLSAHACCLRHPQGAPQADLLSRSFPGVRHGVRRGRRGDAFHQADGLGRVQRVYERLWRLRARLYPA